MTKEQASKKRDKRAPTFEQHEEASSSDTNRFLKTAMVTNRTIGTVKWINVTPSMALSPAVTHTRAFSFIKCQSRAQSTRETDDVFFDGERVSFA